MFILLTTFTMILFPETARFYINLLLFLLHPMWGKTKTTDVSRNDRLDKDDMRVVGPLDDNDFQGNLVASSLDSEGTS